MNLPTPEGVTPLMIALDNEHNDVAKLLMDKGANLDVWDWWGRTALWIAVDRKAGAGGGRRFQRFRRRRRRRPWQVADAAVAGAARSPAAARASARPAVSSMDIINALLNAGVESQSGNELSSSERPRPGTFRGQPDQHGHHAVVPRGAEQRCGSDSGSAGKRRRSQHQHHGIHRLPAGRRGRPRRARRRRLRRIRRFWT